MRYKLAARTTFRSQGSCYIARPTGQNAVLFQDERLFQIDYARRTYQEETKHQASLSHQ
jgi:hypothetical protein